MNPLGMPKKIMLDNYLAIFRLEGFSVVGMFSNSLLLCVVCPTLSALSTVTAGYVMAKYQFTGKKVIHTLYILPMVISICGTTMSTYTLLDSWNLIGNFASMMLISCGGTGMNFLLMYSLFVNVSNTYMEAAEIDGASDFTVFIKIMLPQAMGIVGTLWMLSFIGSWNEYASYQLFLPSHPTVSTALVSIQANVTTGNYANHYPEFFAAIMISIIPVIVLFLAFQEQIMQISLGGGIKG